MNNHTTIYYIDLPFNIFRNATDTIVQQTELLTWQELITFFSTPIITDNKDALMFNLCLFKDEEYRTPLYNPSIDEVGRQAENIIEHYAVIYDFDGGATIAWAKQHFQGIEHFGYTSFNHLKDGITEKFRIILPFKDPCPNHEWSLRSGKSKSFIEAAGGPEKVDGSSCSRARAFYFPATPPERQHLAQHWHHSGELMDWRWCEPTYPQIARPTNPLRTAAFKVGGNGRVIPETFDIVRFCQDQGIYVKPDGYGKHEVICPCYHEHTNQSKSGTVIYESDGNSWANFYCAHTHNFDFYKYYGSVLGKGWMRPYCQCDETTPDDLTAIFATATKI